MVTTLSPKAKVNFTLEPFLLRTKTIKKVTPEFVDYLISGMGCNNSKLDFDRLEALSEIKEYCLWVVGSDRDVEVGALKIALIAGYDMFLKARGIDYDPINK